MFERFTDRARRVLALAQEEARLLSHNFIGPEHILLGLIHEGEGVAAKALESLGISLEAVREKVEETIGPARSSSPGSPPFTPRAKKVLELSLREALQLRHNYIGTEHLILGLLREGEGVGVQVLTSLGVDTAQLRNRVLELLAGELGRASSAEEAPPNPPPFTGAAPAGWTSLTPQARFPHRTCALCGRDLWETERYVSGEFARVCDQCIAIGHQRIEDAESADEGPEIFLPPRVFGDVPSEEAVAQMVTAFEQAFNITDPAEETLYLEDPETLRSYRDEAARRTQQRIATCRVDRLRFVAPDRAVVRFTLTLTAGGTFPIEGLAVCREGRWKVSRQTQADLLRRGGLQVPEVGR